MLITLIDSAWYFFDDDNNNKGLLRKKPKAWFFAPHEQALQTNVMIAKTQGFSANSKCGLC